MNEIFFGRGSSEDPQLYFEGKREQANGESCYTHMLGLHAAVLCESMLHDAFFQPVQGLFFRFGRFSSFDMRVMGIQPPIRRILLN